MHRHRAQSKLSIERGFSGPVAQPQNRNAHGNICRIDTCACGAQRRTNINGFHSERGPWSETSEES